MNIEDFKHNFRPGLIVLYTGEKLVAGFEEGVSYASDDEIRWELYEFKDWYSQYGGRGARYLIDRYGTVFDISDENEGQVEVGTVANLVSTGRFAEDIEDGLDGVAFSVGEKNEN